MDREAERQPHTPSVARHVDGLSAAAAASPHTPQQHALVASHCSQVFAAKLAEYGPAWRMLRLISLVDQIYIKARRIRALEQMQGQRLVEDSASEEYVGIVNYAVIGIVQLQEGELQPPEHLQDLRFEQRWSDPHAAVATHREITERALALVARKNHDYREAWREMAIPSLTDELLSRCVRIKSLLEGERDRERLESQLYDTINYAVFAFIRLAEESGEQ